VYISTAERQEVYWDLLPTSMSRLRLTCGTTCVTPVDEVPVKTSIKDSASLRSYAPGPNFNPNLTLSPIHITLNPNPVECGVLMHQPTGAIGVQAVKNHLLTSLKFDVICILRVFVSDCKRRGLCKSSENKVFGVTVGLISG